MAIEAEIGKRIKQLRKAAGLTQQELADIVGFDRSFLSKIETGSSDCSASQLHKIASVLGVKVGVLFGEPDSNDPKIERLSSDLEKLTPDARAAFEAAIHTFAQQKVEVKRTG